MVTKILQFVFVNTIIVNFKKKIYNLKKP